MLQQPTGGAATQEEERLSAVSITPQSIIIQPGVRTIASGGGNPFEEVKEATGISRQASSAMADPLITDLHIL